MKKTEGDEMSINRTKQISYKDYILTFVELFFEGHLE